LTIAGVPNQVVGVFGQASASGQLDFNKLTGVGDLGAAILAGLPAELQAAVQPFIANIVAGIHEAFSLAVAQTFWLGVGAAIISAIAASTMHEHKLRTSHAPATAAATAAVPESVPVSVATAIE